MGYALLATVLLVVHFGYLGYVVAGGFLAWRWPRAIWPHLLAAAWGIAVVGVPLTCPLTVAEDWARRRAGQAAGTGGFIDRYIEGVLYPPRYTALLQALVAVVVVGSWLGAYRHRRVRSAGVTLAGLDTGVKSEVSSEPPATV